MENHYFTCVTSRHSGGSYLNAGELMNGCPAVAHSNLFIPSTLGGAVNTATGFDETQLKQNLDLASDVYISRVQGAPCGEAKIQLFKGACDEAAKSLVDRRNLLLVYLSGKKEQKEELKENNPKLHDHFESVSKVLQNHKHDLPPKYFLALSLCHKPECPHKRCQEGNKGTTSSWYKGGPLTTYFPLPVQDLSKPWGSECTKCKGRCSGHFLGPEEAPEKVQQGEGVVHLNPPSTVLQKAYNDGIKANRNLNQILEGAEDLAKKTCLSLDEPKMWLKHLDDVRSRRRQGAQKAAATRAAKKSNRLNKRDTKHIYIVAVTEKSQATTTGSERQREMDSSDSSSEICEDVSAFNSYDGRFDMTKKSSSIILLI